MLHTINAIGLLSNAESAFGPDEQVAFGAGRKCLCRDKNRALAAGRADRKGKMAAPAHHRRETCFKHFLKSRPNAYSCSFLKRTYMCSSNKLVLASLNESIPVFSSFHPVVCCAVMCTQCESHGNQVSLRVTLRAMRVSAPCSSLAAKLRESHACLEQQPISCLVFAEQAYIGLEIMHTCIGMHTIVWKHG
jgi:hypothetical protein